VHKDILPAVIRLDESEALLAIEPLDGSLRHVTLPSGRWVKKAARQRSCSFEIWREVVSPTRWTRRGQVIRPKLDLGVWRIAVWAARSPARKAGGRVPMLPATKTFVKTSYVKPMSSRPGDDSESGQQSGDALGIYRSAGRRKARRATFVVALFPADVMDGLRLTRSRATTRGAPIAANVGGRRAHIHGTTRMQLSEILHTCEASKRTSCLPRMPDSTRPLPPRRCTRAGAHVSTWVPKCTTSKRNIASTCLTHMTAQLQASRVTYPCRPGLRPRGGGRV
jgi:hypothetical protein